MKEMLKRFKSPIVISGGGAISFVQCDASGELMLSGTYMI